MKNTSTSSSKNETVTFEYIAPEAKQVQLAGSFNNWNGQHTTLKRDASGRWQVALQLQPGRYEYRYIVDGSWQNEQKRSAKVKNAFGTYNSVIEVPGKTF